MSTAFLDEIQSFKTPHLRDQHKKVGFDKSSLRSDRGFGFLHDGSDDTLLAFLDKPGFQIIPGDEVHIVAFLVSFPTETHAATGKQVTLNTTNSNSPAVVSLLNDMQTVANQGQVSIVAKGFVNGEHRGYAYPGGGIFQSDRAAETVTMNALQNVAAAGTEITFTVVPAGTQTRIGIDRDEDGHFDRDELDAGSDPTNPQSTPGDPCPWFIGDLNNDCVVNVSDLLLLLGEWGDCANCNDCAADLTGDCIVNVSDLLELLANWG